MSIERLGDLGERIVAEYFEQTGSLVELSTNPFDGEKDMNINRVQTEVQFETIMHFFRPDPNKPPYPAFTVPISKKDGTVFRNQLNKRLYAGRWIIVQNPSNRWNEKFIRLWEAPPVGQRHFQIQRNKHDGRYIAGFPLSSFTKIVDIHNEALYNRIKQLDISEFS